MQAAAGTAWLVVIEAAWGLFWAVCLLRVLTLRRVAGWVRLAFMLAAVLLVMAVPLGIVTLPVLAGAALLLPQRPAAR